MIFPLEYHELCEWNCDFGGDALPTMFGEVRLPAGRRYNFRLVLWRHARTLEFTDLDEERQATRAIGIEDALDKAAQGR